MRPDMDRFVVPVLAIWLCVTASIGSVDAASRPGSVVLPAAVEGWIWDGQEAHYDARTVFDYIDGAGELFLAYGFEKLAVADTEYHVGVSDLRRIELVKLGWMEDVVI